MNCLPLNIHFEFDNLFNENKFATKSWFPSCSHFSSFSSLSHTTSHSDSSPPMPTEWIISTLPQRTHYTQLLLAICIPISLYRYSLDPMLPLVFYFIHKFCLSTRIYLILSYFQHAKMGFGFLNMMNGTTLSFSLRLHLFSKLEVCKISLLCFSEWKQLRCSISIITQISFNISSIFHNLSFSSDFN